MRKKLNKVVHDYYCNVDNYQDRSAAQQFPSWAAFLNSDLGWPSESAGDTEMLVFRWDWEPGENVVKLFCLNQRKGFYFSVSVSVGAESERAVRKWLKNRWRYLKRLWRPIS